MTNYEIIKNFIIRTNEDGSRSFIPTDPSNNDYQVYLATLVSESTPTVGNN